MKYLRLTLFTAALAFIVSACSDDQAVVKQLSDGTWRVTDVSYDGVSAPASEYENDTYVFERCRVSRGACDGTYTTVDPTKGETETSFTYTISDDGTTIEISLSLLGIPSSQVYSIDENSDDKFVWSYYDDFSEQEVKTTIEKE